MYMFKIGSQAEADVVWEYGRGFARPPVVGDIVNHNHIGGRYEPTEFLNAGDTTPHHVVESTYQAFPLKSYLSLIPADNDWVGQEARVDVNYPGTDNFEQTQGVASVCWSSSKCSGNTPTEARQLARLLLAAADLAEQLDFAHQNKQLPRR